MRPCFVMIIIGFMAFDCSTQETNNRMQVRQLTFDSKNHNIDNNYNFSPDDQWLIYDTRSTGIGTNPIIEKVNVKTSEQVVVFKTSRQTEFGPGVGAASYGYNSNKIVFIHGLENCNSSNPYAKWRRFGMIIDEDKGNK